MSRSSFFFMIAFSVVQRQISEPRVLVAHNQLSPTTKRTDCEIIRRRNGLVDSAPTLNGERHGRSWGARCGGKWDATSSEVGVMEIVLVCHGESQNSCTVHFIRRQHTHCRVVQYFQYILTYILYIPVSCTVYIVVCIYVCTYVPSYVVHWTLSVGTV
jgi:hypothetical protein